MNLLTSRTFWTLVVMFLVNGTKGLTGFISPEVSVALNAVLTVLAMYFKLNPSQSYGKF